MKIIVAEDEQRMRQGLVRQLDRLGDEYEVIAQASNGQMALDLIVKMKPDVVFMDIKMPFLDGLSVIRAVRSHGLETQFVVVVPMRILNWHSSRFLWMYQDIC